MRLFLKLSGALAVLLFLPLLVLELVVGFWYKSEIVSELKVLADEGIESSVVFDDIEVSALKNFPHLTISVFNISIHESQYQIAQVEKISFHADLLDLYEDNYSLSKLEVIKPRFFAPIDSLGNKYMLRFKKKKENKAAGKVLLDIPKIEIRDALIIVDNAYKKNRIRISVDQGNFRLKSFDDLLEFKGDAVGVLDTMISKGSLNQTAVPIAAHQATFRLNTLDDRKLFDGILQLYGAQLRAYGLMVPAGNGNLLDITLEGDEARINDYLALIPQFKPLKLVQHNPEAQLTLTIRNSGFVDPVSFPNVDILFELKNAAFTRIGLQGKIDSVNFRGRFSNGRERNAKTSEMIIDFGHAKVNNSFFNIKGSISNFEDPFIKIDARSEVELEDVGTLMDIPDLDMSGSIRIQADIEGKISELEKERRSKRNAFDGHLDFENIQITKKQANLKIENMKGRLTVKNKQLILSGLNARFNDAYIHLTGSTHNFLPIIEQKPGQIAHANISLAVNGLSVSKSDYKNWQPNDQVDRASKEFEFPKFLHLNCDIRMKDIGYEDYRAESMKLDLALNNDSMSIQTGHFKIEEGDIWVGAVSRKSTNSRQNYEIWIEADLDQLDTKKYLPETNKASRKKQGSEISLSDFSLKGDIRVKMLKHDKVELQNVRLIASLNDMKLHSKSLSFDFPYGKTKSTFSVDLKDSVHQIIGKSSIALHEFNIDSLKKYYNSIKPKRPTEDTIPTKKSMPFTLDSYVFDITSPKATYQHFEVKELSANLEMSKNRLKLKKSSFEMFDGLFELDGLIRRNEAHDVKAFCNLTASNIDLGGITSNFASSKNEMFSNQHFKGRVGVDGQILLAYNHDLVHQEDQMLGKVNISLSEGELIKFKPITESLKFIKQANRDTILLANPHLEILFHNDEIVLPTTTFKSSLSNIEFSGYHSNDFDFGFDLQISVGDLLFKSQKKKRRQVNDDQEGNIGLIKHYLQARTVDGKLNIKSMKKKAYHHDLDLLDKRYEQVDSILSQMSTQIIQ